MRSDQAEQPSDMRCLFNKAHDAVLFGATPQSSAGFYKLSCDLLAIRRHCVWVAMGDSTPSSANPVTNAVQSVRDIDLGFTYGGQRHEISHSGNRKAGRIKETGAASVSAGEHVSLTDDLARDFRAIEAYNASVGR